jgi:hypothetical protein
LGGGILVRVLTFGGDLIILYTNKRNPAPQKQTNKRRLTL